MLLLAEVLQFSSEFSPVRVCVLASRTSRNAALLMALGFGFNKTKVMASAEKCMQQGKLQNAIAEYLKVTKEDPKDLTVMNTVGDLYARLGQTAEAIQCFKQVGEAYARDGFIVKAIAIYKKLSKLDSGSTQSVLKLAELYTQQGLYNDARAQYLGIADRFLRAGDNQQASHIFRKMLELDPENAAMQAKLADLYVKLGNKQEARNIFFTAAESLFRRGAMEAADEALGRVLALDPGHSPAAMLRGQIAAETGNAEKAIEYLEKVPDLDSQPDALRALLRVHLQTGNISEAMPIGIKLLTVHNDLSGIISCGDHLMAAGQHEAGLRLYDQYADRLLADDCDRVLAKVASAPAHLGNNPAALELVLKLYRKAGDSTHVNEVLELLAHALVEAGELVRARDLYNELAALEPQNELHAKNCRQVSARLGDDAANRPLTPAEEGQALMVDELEIQAPAVNQEYPAEVARAVRSALTDSELLDSYNLPAKAIPPLEAALPSAPRDVLLNQRLASLYARAERYSDAARCCDVLQTVYREAGHEKLATQYAEMGTKYYERAGEAPADHAEVDEPPAAENAPQPDVQQAKPDVEQPEAAQEQQKDASHEWEEMISVEPPDHLAASHFGGASKVKAGDVVGDLLEEIRFYASQGLWEEALAAIEKCTTLATGIPELEELRAQVEQSRSGAPSPVEVEVIEEDSAPEASVAALVFDDDALGEEQETPSEQSVAASQPAIQENVPAVASSPAASETPGALAAAKEDPLAAMVLDIEETLTDDFVSSKSSPRKAAVITSGPPSPARTSPAAPVPVVVKPALPLRAEPVAIPVVPAAAATVIKPQTPQAHPPGDGAGSALAGIFGEFKQEMEAETASADEHDPETHYNLGVAFKEMGLLEEAIGELQKVCRAIDRGHAFSHILEVYTWLAQCLVQKGAPQAAIKWYQRALQLPAVDDETRLGVYYEMATAYEAAGNHQAALDNFMEVYANNIDYRDVAERIQTLKA